MENPVTDLPDPDSPTRPITSPGRSEKETSSTAFTTPALVRKYVASPSTANVGVGLRPADPDAGRQVSPASPLSVSASD